MADKTILLSDDPSKETWNTTGLKIKNNLRDRLSQDGKLAIQYKTDNFGTVKVGKLKSKAGASGFGISLTEEF